MDKIIVVDKEIGLKLWNKSLPVPLVVGEKCIVDSDQSNVPKGYVRVRHGNNKVKSTFRISHFRTLRGDKIT